MENSLGVALMALTLIAGVIAGAIVFPTEKITEVPKIVEVEKPVIMYQDKIVEKLVDNIVEKQLDLKASYLDLAVKDFLNEVEDEDSLQVCNGDSYDIEQIAISKTDKDYNVNVLDLSKGKYNVEFGVKLKYLDTDTEEKCYKDFNVKVAYEEGEDPVVTI